MKFLFYFTLAKSNDVMISRSWASKCRVLRRPTNFSMILITLISITKILWMSIDPFVLKSVLHRSVERLLSELIYSLLYALYGTVLLVWYSSHKKPNKCQFFRYVIYDELSYNINRKRRKWVCRGYKLVKIFIKVY